MHGDTFPIIPKEPATAMKECWIAAGNSLACNPVENILLAVQQLGDQFAIVHLIHPQVQASGGGAVGELLHEMVGVNGGTAEGGVDRATASGKGAVQDANAAVPLERFGLVRQPLILKLCFHNNFKFNRGWRISARR